MGMGGWVIRIDGVEYAYACRVDHKDVSEHIKAVMTQALANHDNRTKWVIWTFKDFLKGDKWTYEVSFGKDYWFVIEEIARGRC